MRPVSVALRVRRVSASSSLAADTVTSVGAISAGSVEDLSTTGEDDGHAPRLEKIVVPRVNKMNSALSLVSFVHFTEEHPCQE